MKRALVIHIPLQPSSISLISDEAKHLVQVLRLRGGEELELLDGKGGFALGRLEIRGKEVSVRSAGRQEDPRRGTQGLSPLELQLAVIKGDAMDWVIEKSVELGVKSIQPFFSDHSVVQLGKKSPAEFQERWQKIADQSLKQCGRLIRLEVQAPITFRKWLETASSQPCLWMDEGSLGPAGSMAQGLPSRLDVLLGNPAFLRMNALIGPEGGWSGPEREALTQRAEAPHSTLLPTRLGNWILRAETAAILTASAFQLAVQARLDRDDPRR